MVKKMRTQIKIQDAILYVPIKKGKDEESIRFYVKKDTEENLLYEFQIPVDVKEQDFYTVDYYARINVENIKGETLIIEGNVSDAFLSAIKNAPKEDISVTDRPEIHFTADNGWINDPNGLVYDKGIYHLYFQYNPFDIRWNNMSWGHAVSRDLLHWQQLDTVLYPDENGTIFSGSGIRNEHKMLDLPEDALIFFYTAAGENFTQKIAYSTDGGKTLTKIDQPCLETVCKENRDPKVFWHEDSKAYIMVLWLEEIDFGIFRSADLKNWVMSDRISLKDAWECPDLVHVSCETGEKKWAFLCADGYYFWGDFDGYHFLTDGVRHDSYFNKNLYAAQTYSGITDRTIFIPWLRFENCGEDYTGVMGIPRELSCINYQGETYLRQLPVKEWFKHLEIVQKLSDDCQTYQIDLKLENEDVFEWSFIVEGVSVIYDRKTGNLKIENDLYQVIRGAKKFSFLIDHDILEIFVEDGILNGAFKLSNEKSMRNRFLSLTNNNNFSKIIYASRK